jgi:hypothetical protein
VTLVVHVFRCSVLPTVRPRNIPHIHMAHAPGTDAETDDARVGGPGKAHTGRNVDSLGSRRENCPDNRRMYNRCLENRCRNSKPRSNTYEFRGLNPRG